MPSRNTSHKGKKRSKDYLPELLLLVSILLGLAASAYLYSGPDPFYDDAWYIHYAHDAIVGDSDFIANLFAYAFLNIIAIAASFLLFGYGSFQAILPSIVEYVLLLIVAFQISKRVYGGTFAAASVYLLALAPFLTDYVTRVLPDINMGFAVGLSLYAFILARKEMSVKMSAVAGLLAAYTIYVKTQAFMYVGLFALLIVIEYISGALKRKKTSSNFKEEKMLAAAAAGLAVGLFAYFAVFYAVTGNAFASLNYMASPSGETIAREVYMLLTPFGNTSAMLNSPSAFNTYPIGPLVILAIVGTAIGLLKRNSYVDYISLVCWAMSLYLIFGSSSINAYYRVPALSRYFAIDAVPFAFLGGYALLSLYDFAKARLGKNNSILKAAFVIFVIVLPIAYIPTYRMLKVDSISIVYSNNIFSNAVSYIQRMASTEGALDIYTLAPTGFRFNTLYYLEFADKYNSNIRALTLHENPYGNETSLACTKSDYERISYLFMVEPQYGPPTIDEQNLIAKWLDSNCTRSEVYQAIPPNASYYSKIVIYRIESASQT
ncbi:MAG: glycosyltransferase family 39 protein [Candidatus Micrarchaeia archaeon]